jgi:hypothetical protein
LATTRICRPAYLDPWNRDCNACLMRSSLLRVACCLGICLGFVVSARAQTVPADSETTAAEAAALAQTSAPPPVASEYSDAYRMRANIHRISSFAMLPLFAAEAVIGQSLYSDPTSGKKDAHLIAAAGIGALFAVNTVTGVWNLLEARHDPVHRKRRVLHGLMMLGADAGFVATAALAPEHDEGSRAAHRAVAFTSIGLATTGYLIMLFGGD